MISGVELNKLELVENVVKKVHCNDMMGHIRSNSEIKYEALDHE